MEFYNRNWRVPSSWNGTEDNNNKVSNYSMSFDGSSEYVDLNDNNIINGFTSVSFSFWVNVTTGDNYDGILCSRNGSDYILIYINNVSGSNFKINIQQNTTSGGSYTRTTSPTVTFGNWYNVVCAGTVGGKWDLYINGDNTGQTQGSNNITAITQSSNFLLGSDGLIGGRYLNCLIDEAAIFDYALSQAQVTQLYGSSSTGVGNPMAITNGRKPIAYYPLGDHSAFNGEYLVANSALSDYVFNFIPNDKIVIADTGVFTNASVFSISLWLNPNSFASGGGHVAFDTSNLPSATESVRILYYSSNTLDFRIVTGGSTSQCKFTTTEVDKWANFVMVFDGSQTGNDKVKAFKNGLPITLTYTGASLPSTVNISEDIGLGNFVSTYANAYNGKMSNVSVFNSALPATGTESVQSLYNYGTPPDISSYSGLQGWWKLDAGSTFDGSNWTVPDESSNSNNGTSSGMTAANLVQSNLNILSPYSRYALSYDGTNDKITGTGALISGNESRSFSLWYKTSSTAAQIPFSLGGSTDQTIGSQFAYCINRNSTTTAGIFGKNMYYDISEFTVPETSDGNWHHLVVTYDQSALNVYIDGNLEATPSPPSRSYVTSDGFTISGWSIAGNRLFDGELSNVSVWNAALTASQVTEIYNEGKPSNLNNHSAYSNLVSWWQLGENSSFNSNWTVIDEKGTNNGTSVNMTEDDLVDGVGTTANGLSSGMGGADNINGDAPYSTSNALSYGMGADAKSTSVPT